MAISDILCGSIERVTSHNEENGWCVLKVAVKGKADLVAVIGSAITVNPGDEIECKGEWVNHPVFGNQFKCSEMSTKLPSTLAGIKKFLSSKVVKGIGPHCAEILVNAFGEKVFDVIDNNPEKLCEIKGIGKKRVEQITVAWVENKEIRNIMVFLQTNGITTTKAAHIYLKYGQSAIKKINKNPYCLADDIKGIGFKTADSLAIKLGIPHDSIFRARSGIKHYMFSKIAENGHCACEKIELAEGSSTLLDISIDIIENAIKEEQESNNIVAEKINGKECYFLSSLYTAEQGVANNINRLLIGNIPWGDIDTEKAIQWAEKQIGIDFSETQKRAIVSSLTNKINVITGGPGVGKTTIINAILKIALAKKATALLCAPTGKAAKRMSESTGLEAKTIHRLLGKKRKEVNDDESVDIEEVDKQKTNLLNCDLLIIDEMSMVDILLLNKLLAVVPSNAAIIFVGDIDQLPSVGPGAVLHDLIASEQIQTVRLTEIFRQAEKSLIIVNAHRVNRGKHLENNNGEDVDFYYIKCEDPEEIRNKIIQCVTDRIPKKFGYDPIKDIQVLSPMKSGTLGTMSLNTEFQKLLNPNKESGATVDGKLFLVGDKVMQRVNNYDKMVFNGDVGFIKELDKENSIATVSFDDQDVTYDLRLLDSQVQLCYATTIHKSQGSEYPVVIIPLSTQHFMMLQRNLLYTAITRGKKLVVVIAQVKAVEIAIKNAESAHRITNLSNRIIDRCQLST